MTFVFQGPGRRSLKVRLLLLVAMAVAPCAVLVLYQTQQQIREDTERAYSEASTLARLSASWHDELVAKARTLLTVLANVPSVKVGSAVDCDALMQTVVGEQPWAAAIWRAGPDGLVDCLSDTTVLRPVDISDRAYFRQALSDRRLTLSGLLTSRATGQPIIVAALPILGPGGGVTSVIGVAMDLEWMSRTAAEVARKPDSVMMLIDAQGTVLARHSAPEQFVGQPFADHPLIGHLLAEGTGVTEAVGLDGMPRLFGFVRVGESVLAIGRERTAVLSDAVWQFRFSLAVLTLSVTASICLAMLGARRWVLRWIDILAAAARDMGAGKLGVRAAVPDAVGELAELARAFNDMSGRVTEATQRLQDLTEVSTDWFWETGADHRFTLMSDGVRSIGLDPGRVIGKRRHELASPAGGAEKWLAYEGYLNARAAFRDFAYSLIGEDGCERHIIVSGKPVFGRDGEFLGYRGTGRDVSDFVRHEQEIQAARDQLEQQARDLVAIAEDLDRARLDAEEQRGRAEAASRTKSEFLASMSHEIRTPMNGVMGMTALLLDSDLTLEQKSCADAIRDSADALLGIIDDILDISKLEAGKVELETTDFMVGDVVEGVIGLLAPRARERGLELGILVESDVQGAFRGDPTRLRQVLMNLVGNAVKFTDRGSVAVEVRRQEAGHLRFEVKDTGIGMTPDQAGRMFQPFTQADASTTRRFGGTGLGLSICRELVTLMGGEIGVSSPINVGSTFWFTVPLEASTGLAVSVRTLPEQLHGLRALVVDDLEMNRRILRHHLQQVGIDVHDVAGGMEALGALNDAWQAGSPYDMVVTDHHMPGMSGEALLSWIRPNPQFTDVKVVLASSIGAVERRNAGEPAFDAVLTKPLRRQAIDDCLLRLYGSTAAAEPLGSRPTVVMTAARSGLRVLLVDDNQINLRVATMMLSRAGYDVDAAEHGEAAVEAARAGCYDLILMDIQMPGMDGVEATARIRGLDGEPSRVSIIAMTANAMTGMREEYLRAGMDDYISKPFAPEQFLKVVAAWAGRQHNGAAPPAGMLAPVGSAAPSLHDLPVLDGQALDFLRGDVPPDVFRDLVVSFVEDLGSRLERIRIGAEAGDLDGLRREAHDLLSTAGNMGARRLEALARDLDHACRARGVAGVTSAVAAVGIRLP